MNLWLALLILLATLLWLAGCETRTLQSCLASMVLLGPVEVRLQCPPHDAYTHGAPDLPGEGRE